ncbi:uncharacterized protein LOC141712359 [Apium graveolens]|uniref:uncharacterized protein LOC141712359 n=1 Tax=Apium graveolens TaxID=4045 RepID=UPI003D7B92C7
MQTDSELRSTQNLFFSHEEEEKEFAEIAAKISEDFDFKLTFLGLSTDHESEDSEQVGEEPDHNEAQVLSDADDDFSFVINSSDSTSDSSTNASIRPHFPLFNRDLLLAREDYKTSDHKSVSKPPVDKIFMETTSSSSKKGENNSDNDTVDGIASGPYCAWDQKTSPELSKKSNSTGFSKLWRFKEYLSRSHSDGNDAFVFLNKPVHKKPAEVKVNGEKKVVKKVKKSTELSAHEVYLRSKGIYPEHDKRRSYLPYKPEVVGFFTSVNGGGLSKNVHPY